MGKKISLGHLVYELTEACNQNCRFCYNHWRPSGCQPADSKLAGRTLSRILKQADKNLYDVKHENKDSFKGSEFEG